MSPNVAKMASEFTASDCIWKSEQHTLSKPHMLKGPVYKWGSTSPIDAFTGRGTHV